MTIIDKHSGFELIKLQAVAQGARANRNTPINPWQTGNAFATTLVLCAAPLTAVAISNPGEFFIRMNPKGAGDDTWVTLDRYPGSAITPVNTTLTTGESAGTKTLKVAATTGFSLGETVYIQDKTTLANGQWAVVENIAGASITLMEGLETAKAANDVVQQGAEIFVAQFDLTAINRLQVDFLNTGTDAPQYHVQAFAIHAKPSGGA